MHKQLSEKWLLEDSAGKEEEDDEGGRRRRRRRRRWDCTSVTERVNERTRSLLTRFQYVDGQQVYEEGNESCASTLEGTIDRTG